MVAGAPGERAPASPDELEALDAEIRTRIGAGASSREIAAELARPGLPRREVYARAVALRDAAAQATTIVTSPRAPSAKRSASSGSVPRATSS